MVRRRCTTLAVAVMLSIAPGIACATAPAVSISASGLPHGSMLFGDPYTAVMSVTNHGKTPLENLVLTFVVDPGGKWAQEPALPSDIFNYTEPCTLRATPSTPYRHSLWDCSMPGSAAFSLQPGETKTITINGGITYNGSTKQIKGKTEQYGYFIHTADNGNIPHVKTLTLKFKGFRRP